MSSPPSETMQVEVLRAAYEEESAPGLSVQEKMVEAPGLMGVVGANMSPRADGYRANGTEPQPEHVLDRAALTPRTSKGSGFNPSREAALDDVASVPGSYDIVDLGTGEPGLPRYPQAQLLPASSRQVVGGAELTCSRVTMFYNRPESVPRWKEEITLPDFSLSSLCYLMPSFFDSTCST
jgi:hypothetical protein